MQIAKASTFNRNSGDRISCYAAPDTSTCAVFIEENRMQIAKASTFNRKSGEMWEFATLNQ